jgi:hypothetical protein
MLLIFNEVVSNNLSFGFLYNLEASVIDALSSLIENDSFKQHKKAQTTVDD